VSPMAGETFARALVSAAAFTIAVEDREKCPIWLHRAASGKADAAGRAALSRRARKFRAASQRPPRQRAKAGSKARRAALGDG